ncbi:hypothetical protein VIGAN_04014500, partial [Vigna angularis var. angularis]
TIDPFGQFPYNLIIIFHTILVHFRIATILPNQRDSSLTPLVPIWIHSNCFFCERLKISNQDEKGFSKYQTN